MVQHCGPTSSGSDNAMYKSDFKGACADMSTCDPEDMKKMMELIVGSMGSGEGSGSGSGSDSGSGSGSGSGGMPAGMCSLYVGFTSEPGKCQADCFGGYSSLALCELFVFLISLICCV